MPRLFSRVWAFVPALTVALWPAFAALHAPAFHAHGGVAHQHAGGGLAHSHHARASPHLHLRPSGAVAPCETTLAHQRDHARIAPADVLSRMVPVQGSESDAPASPESSPPIVSPSPDEGAYVSLAYLTADSAFAPVEQVAPASTVPHPHALPADPHSCLLSSRHSGRAPPSLV